eukprot:8544309-Pyramimonas_sp.AAC.1
MTRHAELQGTDDQGRKRTVLAAVYPVGQCRSLVKDMAKHMHACRSQAFWTCKRCQHGEGSGVPHSREDGCRFKPVPP